MPSVLRFACTCRFQAQGMHTAPAAGNDLGPSAALNTVEGMRPDVLAGLASSYSQLVQGCTHPPNFSQGGQPRQEEMWRCSSASSQISLPAMRDAAPAAQTPPTGQLEMQVVGPIQCPLTGHVLWDLTLLYRSRHVFKLSRLGECCDSEALTNSLFQR